MIRTMARYCFQLQVRPERLAEYRERHRAVWPEMLAALRDTGWRNYSLFLRDDGLLIGYVESDDLAASAGRAWPPPTSTRGGRPRWRRSSSTSQGRPDEGFVLLDGGLPPGGPARGAGVVIDSRKDAAFHSKGKRFRFL